MIYVKYIEKAKELVIREDEETGIYYLDPNWLYILYTSGLSVEDIYEPFITSKHDIEDVLKLEVERLNIHNNHSKYVVDWVYNVITTDIDPIMLQEENELLQNAMSYLKVNGSIRTKEVELQERENAIKEKENAVQFIPNGMSFAKKE